MRLRFLLMICLIIASAGVAQGSQDRPYVLLPRPGKQGAPPPMQQADRNSYGIWHPSYADIASLESRLSGISELTPVNWRSNIHIDEPRKYFRQYMGVSHQGLRRILINAFCDSPPTDWHDRLVVVTDGGTCFWQALYDPSTGAFSDLTINGRA
jgi:hypothetical protein